MLFFVTLQLWKTTIKKIAQWNLLIRMVWMHVLYIRYESKIYVIFFLEIQKVHNKLLGDILVPAAALPVPCRPMLRTEYENMTLKDWLLAYTTDLRLKSDSVSLSNIYIYKKKIKNCKDCIFFLFYKLLHLICLSWPTFLVYISIYVKNKQ